MVRMCGHFVTLELDNPPMEVRRVRGQNECNQRAEFQQFLPSDKLMLSLPTDPHLALKAVMMPCDTNPVGTVFGGVLLSYIDQAGVVGAVHEIARNGWTRQPLVTVAMNAVEFHQPVFVGDVVSFWSRVVRIGTTSITVHVSVEADRNGQAVRLTEAEVVYVAIDPADRRPLPIRDESPKS